MNMLRLYFVLDNGNLIIAHAGIKEELIGQTIQRLKPLSFTGILLVKNTLMAHPSDVIGHRI